MPIRYVGAILVFVSCGAFGFLKAAICRREERCLAELVRLLETMQSELEYRLTPLPQICANAANAECVCLQQVFSSLSQELESQTAPDAASCMQAALSSIREIPSSVQKALLLLGNSLGKFDLNGQINEIAAAKQYCLSLLDQMRDNRDVRLRSYQTLGLCIGAGLAILFL